MKIRVIPKKDIIELDIPDYVFKAYDATHFKFMLADWLREVMMKPDWWDVSTLDLAEAEIAYKRRRKGLDRVEGERERGNLRDV